MASSSTAKMQVMDTKSKGTMPKAEYDVVAYKAIPQTDKPGMDKSLWEAGDQVPPHAKDVSKNGGGVYIDSSIDRMHDDTSIYKSF